MRIALSERNKILHDALSEYRFTDASMVFKGLENDLGHYALSTVHVKTAHALIDKAHGLLVASDLPQQQLVDELQEISAQLNKILNDNLMANENQAWFMRKMRILGYAPYVSSKGECFGVSNMAIQAFFLNDLDTFENRLHTICQLDDLYFKNDFQALRAKQTKLMTQGQIDEARALNQAIVDIYAYFDGVSLTQFPFEYPLGEDGRMLSQKQRVLETRPITQSVQSEIPDETGVCSNQPEIIASVTGAYTKKELGDYIDLLKQSLGSKSFALHLISNNHAIMLAYNAEISRWILVNANHLPGEEYNHTDVLLDDLWTALLNEQHSTLILGTQVNVRTQDASHLKKQFDMLQQTTSWLELHDPIKMNGKFSHRLSSLAKIYEPNTRKTDDQAIMKELVKRKYYSEAAHFMTVRRLTGSKVDFKQIFSSISPAQQSRWIAALTLDQKASVAEHIWHLLPRSDYIPVFLRLELDDQAEYISDFPENDDLFERLLTLFKLGKQVYSIHDLSQATNLFDQLSLEDKQAFIDASSTRPRIMAGLFLMLSDDHRITVFIQMNTSSRNQLLSALSDKNASLKSSLIEMLDKTHAKPDVQGIKERLQDIKLEDTLEVTDKHDQHYKHYKH